MNFFVLCYPKFLTRSSVSNSHIFTSYFILVACGSCPSLEVRGRILKPYRIRYNYLLYSGKRHTHFKLNNKKFRVIHLLCFGFLCFWLGIRFVMVNLLHLFQNIIKWFITHTTRVIWLSTSILIKDLIRLIFRIFLRSRLHVGVRYEDKRRSVSVPGWNSLSYTALGNPSLSGDTARLTLRVCETIIWGQLVTGWLETFLISWNETAGCWQVPRLVKERDNGVT